MVKCLPEFEYFTVFLKNKNIIFKIRRSKVTDYATLNKLYVCHLPGLPGEVFMRLLMLTILPLIIASIIAGVYGEMFLLKLS